MSKPNVVAGKLGAAATAALVILLSTGCTTKNYVRSQAGPLINQTNDLDAKTSADHRTIVDTDQRAQQGITTAKNNAASADQHAGAAQTSADAANGNAQQAYNRVDSLTGVVAGLDRYKQLSDTSVTFGFDKSVLSASDRRQLDTLATSLQTSRHYIVQLTGGTDSVGSAQYNYDLSQKRADAVANYLQAKYGIAPHKFYLVGIGKDAAVATNKTTAGRAKNRRVDVQVLSNMQDENATTTASATPANPS